MSPRPATSEESEAALERVVSAGRVLRLLGVGLLGVALLDLVVVVAIFGWYRGATAHPHVAGELTPLLWGAVGALVGVGLLAVILSALLVATLLAVRTARSARR